MFGFFVAVILFSWATAGPAPHSTAIMSVALVFSTSRREGLIGLSTLRIVSTSLTFRCLWLGLKDGLDSAALVHRAVALSNLIQGECKVEDLTGMDLFRPDQIDQPR